MALPDGSMVLICPVGPEYSQVSDTDFDYWSGSVEYHVEEITDMDIFGTWYSNIKRVTTDYTDSKSPSLNYTSNGIQWTVDDFFIAVVPNTGDHPFPKTQWLNPDESVDGTTGIETPEDLPGIFTYVNEEYLTGAYSTGIPLFFIHRGRFYFMLPLQVASDYASYTGVSISTTSLNWTQTYDPGDGPITLSYTITIDQLFYP